MLVAHTQSAVILPDKPVGATVNIEVSSQEERAESRCAISNTLPFSTGMTNTPCTAFPNACMHAFTYPPLRRNLKHLFTINECSFQVDVLAKMVEQSVSTWNMRGRLDALERRLGIVVGGDCPVGADPSGCCGNGGGGGRGQGWVFGRLWRWVGSRRKRGVGDTVFKA
jgi:hypothetical protein